MESLMTSYLKTGLYIQMDEATCRVFGEPGREDTKKSYMWLGCGGPAHIQDFSTGYSGFLQTDGYEAYNTSAVLHTLCVRIDVIPSKQGDDKWAIQ
jgi:hypothetical protein